ncbi:hypothetical protein GCM10027074_74810 [Streptomyces deserti]
MQGTAAAPTPPGSTASAVPEAPAVSARAARSAVLVRLMSADFLSVGILLGLFELFGWFGRFGGFGGFGLLIAFRDGQ